MLQSMGSQRVGRDLQQQQSDNQPDFTPAFSVKSIELAKKFDFFVKMSQKNPSEILANPIQLASTFLPLHPLHAPYPYPRPRMVPSKILSIRIFLLQILSEENK